MDQEPPPSILDEIEVSRLGPPLSPRARVRRLIISVAAVLLALLVVFAGSPTLRQDARALFSAPTPTRTLPSLPGADSFYFLATPPWVTVLVDGRPLDRVPVADDHPAPLQLPRGVHTFEWRGAPFLTQHCTLPVPLPFLFTPRGSQPCRLPTQDCRHLCTATPSLVAGSPGAERGAWVVAVPVQAAWQLNTVGITAVSSQLQGPGPSALLALVRITWDGTHWQVMPLLGHTADAPVTGDAGPVTDDLVWAPARDRPTHTNGTPP